MGPVASADFVARLVASAGALADTEHPRILLDSNPGVPDRNAAARGEGASPGPALAAMARGLVGAGAEVLAMPCNAAHGWSDAIRNAAPEARFVDMVAETVAAAIARRVPRVGVVAVQATHALGLYSRPLEQAGLAVIEADPQKTALLVKRVKAGDLSRDARQAAADLAAGLVARGAGLLVMACTEIPLVLAPDNSPAPLLDPTAVLTSATLAAARRTGVQAFD
jgi:aspartate racemase